MKKGIIGIVLLGLLLIAGWGQDMAQKEEAVITEVNSIRGNVTFSLDQNWTILQGEEAKKNYLSNGSAAYELVAENSLTGSSITASAVWKIPLW